MYSHYTPSLKNWAFCDALDRYGGRGFVPDRYGGRGFVPDRYDGYCIVPDRYGGYCHIKHGNVCDFGFYHGY